MSFMSDVANIATYSSMALEGHLIDFHHQTFRFFPPIRKSAGSAGFGVSPAETAVSKNHHDLNMNDGVHRHTSIPESDT